MKTSGKIKAVLFICIMSIANSNYAQWKEPIHQLPDTSISKFNYQISLSTGVISNFHKAEAYIQVAPSFSYQVNSKFRVNAGFSFLSDLNPNGYIIGKKDEPDLSPRKDKTQMASVYVQTEYMPNDRLWISASAFYIGGTLSSLTSGFGSPLDLSTFGGVAALRYRIGENTFIDFNVAVIRSNQNLPPFLWNSYFDHSPYPFSGFNQNPFYWGY